jgi:predicted HTH transcriptional regulator
MAKSKYTWEDLLNFINQPKNPEIEFKSSLIESKELAQLMVSFANSNGGTLILGFNKANVQLTGFPHDKEWILTASKRDCSPSLNIGVSEIVRGNQLLFFFAANVTDVVYFVRLVVTFRNTRETMEHVLEKLFFTLKTSEILLPGLILKTSMALPGKDGVEKYYDRRLNGNEGGMQVEVNSRGE